jgi:hypothetical protein
VGLRDPSGLSSIDGHQTGGQVLGAYTEVSGALGNLLDASTLANSGLANAASTKGLSISGFLLEEAKALLLYEAAHVADATGHTGASRVIRGFDTLTNVTASSDDVVRASSAVGDAATRTEVGLLGKMFGFINSNHFLCQYFSVNLDVVAGGCR